MAVTPGTRVPGSQWAHPHVPFATLFTNKSLWKTTLYFQKKIWPFNYSGRDVIEFLHSIHKYLSTAYYTAELRTRCSARTQQLTKEVRAVLSRNLHFRRELTEEENKEKDLTVMNALLDKMEWSNREWLFDIGWRNKMWSELYLNYKKKPAMQKSESIPWRENSKVQSLQGGNFRF